MGDLWGPSLDYLKGCHGETLVWEEPLVIQTSFAEAMHAFAGWPHCPSSCEPHVRAELMASSICYLISF